MKVLNRIILSFVLTLFATTPMMAQDLIVIVNKANPTTSLSEGKIGQIYSGRMTMWENKVKIVPCDQKPSLDIAKNFLKTYLKKSASEYQSMWMSKMLSGEGTAPKALTNDTEVIDFVKKNEGSIGYILQSSLVEDVKQVNIE